MDLNALVSMPGANPASAAIQDLAWRDGRWEIVQSSEIASRRLAAKREIDVQRQAQVRSMGPPFGPITVSSGISSQNPEQLRKFYQAALDAGAQAGVEIGKLLAEHPSP